MAIIECPECRELMNENENECPNCGAVLTAKRRKSSNPSLSGQDEPKLILGLPIGNWIAGLIFIICAILIFLCIYISLSKNGLVKSDIADKIPIKEVSNEPDKKVEVLLDESFGTIESYNKNYSKYISKTDGFECLIPESYQVCYEDENTFFFPAAGSDGKYTVPYIVVKKESDYSDPIEFLQEYYGLAKEAYTDQSFKLSENISKWTDKEIYEFQFTYVTGSGYEIRDTRIATSVDGTLYMIAKKDLADGSIEITEDVIEELLTSFKTTK